MKCSGLQKSRQTSWKIQLLKSKNVQSSFYPTTPVTTVQESVQWENSCLVIFHKVSSLDSCIFSFRRSERFVIIHLKNYRFHLQIIFIFINYPNQVNFNLMGIPFPHTLGPQLLPGDRRRTRRLRKPTVLLSSGDDMHHGRISSWALRSLKSKQCFFNSG